MPIHEKCAENVHATTLNWRSFYWTCLFASFAIVALLLMLPHWGMTVQDSQAYFDTARYLRGELPITALSAPFPYRLVVPAIAAYLPGDLRNTFACVNWAAMSVAAAAMSWTVARVGGSSKQVIAAGLLLVVSVPTFWYASYLLTDPGAICARAIFVLGVVTGQPWLALLAGLAATAIREENILLLLWLLAFRRVGLAVGLASVAVAVAWLLFVRWYLIPGLPSYFWVPNLDQVWAALRDVRSLLSLAGAAFIVVPLAILGWNFVPRSLSPMKSLLVLMALPPAYAALSVRVDGRAIWSLYPFLVPIALYAVMPFRRHTADAPRSA